MYSLELAYAETSAAGHGTRGNLRASPSDHSTGTCKARDDNKTASKVRLYYALITQLDGGDDILCGWFEAKEQ